MCAILDRYGIKCTFNVNSKMMEAATGGGHHLSLDEALALYDAGGHEVACHGVTHAYYKRLPGSHTVLDVFQDRVWLENAFGRMVRGFAYPFSAYDENVVEALRACGIVHARGGDSSFCFALPEDFLRIRPTVRHNHPRFLELAQTFVRETVRYDPTWFCLMGHSYEFADADNWQLLEDFCALVGNREDIWYATVGQLHDYVEAYGRLIWSADAKCVQNPTQTKLWLEYNGTRCAVEPGETKRFEA
jgi:hypothetical protein